jgi:hypothetical protein
MFQDKLDSLYNRKINATAAEVCETEPLTIWHWSWLKLSWARSTKSKWPVLCLLTRSAIGRRRGRRRQRATSRLAGAGRGLEAAARYLEAGRRRVRYVGDWFVDENKDCWAPSRVHMICSIGRRRSRTRRHNAFPASQGKESFSMILGSILLIRTE